jgi:hypothetical protein
VILAFAPSLVWFSRTANWSVDLPYVNTVIPMMTPVPKASSYGADWNDKTNRFHTAMEEDMVLNAAVGKGVMDVPSSGSLAAIQKMTCTPCSLG